MHKLLYLLAIFGAALIASPAFWWLIAADYGAAPSVRVHQDGTAVQTLTGPKSPWPEWAVVPGSKSLTVHGWEPTAGGGSAEFEANAFAARLDVAKGLSELGWDVRFWLQIAGNPDNPREPQRLCILRAQKAGDGGQRNLVMPFKMNSDEKRVSVSWYQSIVVQPPIGTPDGC